MKTISTLLGLAIGDALGQPFECKDADTIKKSGWDHRYVTGVHLNLKPGQWTDDTKMALALARVLVNNGKFTVDAASKFYIEWYESGDWRGMGKQTQSSIKQMIDKKAPLKCGEIMIRKNHDHSICANGSVMRVAPVGVFYRHFPLSLKKSACNDATMTHDHKDAREGSLAIASLIAKLCLDMEPFEAVRSTIDEFESGNIKAALIAGMKYAESGECIHYVIKKFDTRGMADSTIGSAIYCFLSNLESFKNAIVDAIYISGDTDTRAAVVGALSGTHLGLEGIPSYYVDNVEMSDTLKVIDLMLVLGPVKIKELKEKYNW